jgi:hypothetical protein
MMLIVVPPKRVDFLLRVVERREPMHVQTFFPESSIEGFDGRVVRRFAPPAEVQDDTMGVGPQIHRRTDELGAIVAVDALGQAALETEALERGHHVAPAQAPPRVNRQALTREQIEYRQRAEASSIGELIGDEVHAPDVIARGRGATLLAVDRRRVAPRPLASQREAFLGVQPVHALLADVPPFALQQDEEPAIAEADARLGQLPQPLPQAVKGSRPLAYRMLERQNRAAPTARRSLTA